MTRSADRSRDRAIRRYQKDHPGMSLSDARRAVERAAAEQSPTPPRLPVVPVPVPGESLASWVGRIAEQEEISRHQAMEVLGLEPGAFASERLRELAAELPELTIERLQAATGITADEARAMAAIAPETAHFPGQRHDEEASDPGSGSGAEALLRDLLQGGRGRRPALGPLGMMGSYEGEVTVDLGADLFGHPLRTTRDLLKRADPFGLQIRNVRGPLNLGKAEALVYLRQLVDAGLLVAPDDVDDEPQDDPWGPTRDYRTWMLTPAGRILAYASGRKPSTRRSADTLVAKVVKAAAVVNDNPDSLWWVKEIRGTGAYADTTAEWLLHVDLAVDLRPRLADRNEQRKAEQRQRDAAEDRGSTELVRDLVGYGHWRTRLALAGKSKVLRLFRLEPDLPGPVLFHEDRNLTVETAPTAPYQPPAEPEPLDRCSWCLRAVAATRVARRGESSRQSTTGLCETCIVLARCAPRASADYHSLSWTIRQTLTSLTEDPFHSSGCALCGNGEAREMHWWPCLFGKIEEEAVHLPLCDVCPGLLLLVDRPDREGWWTQRHEAACVTGLHARLGTVDASMDGKPARRKKLAKLTDIHQSILDAVGRFGALSALDLARQSDRQELPHQDAGWWAIRFGHLLDHEQLVPLRGDQDEQLPYAQMRLLHEAERDLRRSMRALHTPGPVWDGTRVIEPESPQEWTSQSRQLAVLSTARDQQAQELRAARFADHEPRR
ncbi:TniQ family protein [Streptomyces sp. NPDC005538]|uniref:TniQ family protein n=1 Tax=Streptomyces sp. NPDC005538 TaxID=3157043 RepID=UPI0033BB9C71